MSRYPGQDVTRFFLSLRAKTKPVSHVVVGCVVVRRSNSSTPGFGHRVPAPHFPKHIVAIESFRAQLPPILIGIASPLPGSSGLHDGAVAECSKAEQGLLHLKKP